MNEHLVIPARVKNSAALGLAVAAFLLAAPAAGAEVFTVTRSDDPAPGACLPADCSLREAVAASNASTAVDDQIVVPASATPYAVDIEALKVTDAVEISAAGADKSVLEGDGNNQIFFNESPGVVIAGLAITGGEGGIQNNGELTLRRVSIDHNTRSGSGGGIQSNGPLTVDSSFIGFNQGSGTAGGGIQSNAPVTVRNSTVSGNISDGTSAIKSNDSLTISSSAIVANISTSALSPALRATALTLRDSIVVGNINTAGTRNCNEPVTSLGGNVEDTGSCAVGPGDRPNVDPGLGPRELHGGTTLVYSLLPGSPAIDFTATCPALDQRGAPRPLGAVCDSGPFEFEPPPAPPPPPGDKDFSILVVGGRLKLSSRGVARLKLTCPATELSPPCSGKVVLRTRAKVRFGAKVRVLPLATTRFSLEAGKAAMVALKLPAAKAELVRGSKAARQVLAEVTAAARNREVVSKALRLKL